MARKSDTPGRTDALFPDLAPKSGRGSANLRKAAELFEVAAEATSSDENPTQARDLHTGDLFAWGARQQQVRLRGAPGQSGPRPGPTRPFFSGPGGTDVPTRRPGLTRCLDGAPRGVGRVGHHRRVSRNRLIFSLLLLCVAVYVTIRIVVAR